MNSLFKKQACSMCCSILSILLLVCSCSAIDSNNKGVSIDDLSIEKVESILKDECGAKEYDDSCSFANNTYYYDDEFKKGFYITSKGNYSDTVNIKSYSGYRTGAPISLPMYKEIIDLNSVIDEEYADYIMFRQSTGDGRVLLLYVEFDDSREAKKCFEYIMEGQSDSLFGQSSLEDYEEELELRDKELEDYEGSVLADYLTNEPPKEEVIQLGEIDKDNYNNSSKSAYFGFSLNWNISGWGDANKWEKNPSIDYETKGVVGHSLSVEDNKLLLIVGFDYSKDSGDIGIVSQLCSVFDLDSPFDVDTEYDLRKYLLFYYRFWQPPFSRINTM